MKKIEIHMDLEKIALVSCTIAAILLAIEMIAVTVYRVQNAFIITTLVFGMSVAISICVGAVLIQYYLDHMSDSP